MKVWYCNVSQVDHAAGWPRFDPGCQRAGDFSLLQVQAGPEVHSASYKIVPVLSQGGKGG